MLIQPVQPILVRIQLAQDSFDCQMVSLSDTTLELNCISYLDVGSEIAFFGRHFRGTAIIQQTKYTGTYFKYTLFINKIQFRPGLIINTQL